MSGSYSIRTKGDPYFAFWSQTRNLFINDNQFGDENTVEIEFALYSLPPQYFSATDMHALFSFFVDRFVVFLSETILTVGITPFGGIVVENTKSEQIGVTPQGVVPADGRFRTLVVTATGASVAAITLDDVPIAVTNTGIADPGYSNGYNTGLMLFNDKGARTRLNAAIRRVKLAAGDTLIEYHMDEGHGRVIAPEVIAGEDIVPGSDVNLYGDWYNPNGALLYGPVPDPLTSSANSAFHWQLRTEYRRRPRTKTDYRRRRTTWLV